MTENIEFQPWMESPWVECMTDYENDVDQDINCDKIAWFDVRLDIGETVQERKERTEAISQQINLGILQPNGYPVGMAVPAGARVEGAPDAISRRRGGFGFPGAIGIPLPSKFGATPVTRHLREAGNRGATKLPPHIPGTLPSLGFPQELKNRNIFEAGNEKLKRIQELTRDRRK